MVSWRALIVFCEGTPEFRFHPSQGCGFVPLTPPFSPATSTQSLFPRDQRKDELRKERPKPSGICNKYQWNKEISKHIHKACFFMVIFSVLGDSTQAGPHSKTVAMAKRLVLLTREHIVVFKSCKWSGYKGKPPLPHPRPPPPAAPTQSRQRWGLYSLIHAFTQHGKAFLSESSLHRRCKLAFGDVYETSTSFRIDSAGEKRIHKDEALACVLRPPYIHRNFAFSACFNTFFFLCFQAAGLV